MLNVIFAIWLLAVILLLADVAVTLYSVGIDEFLAPAYVHRVPGGAVYWFLIKGGK